MNSGIYKLYWENNDYFYFGSSKDLKRRKHVHAYQLKRKNHYNKFLQRLFNKYGLPIFEIIRLCEIKNLKQDEQYYINENISNKYCVNICEYTNKGTRGIKWTECQKQNLCNIFIGRKPPRTKLLLNIETGIFYETMKEAQETINKGYAHMYYNLNKSKKNRTPFIYV